MEKCIDAEKLIKSVNNYQEGAKAALNPIDGDADYYKGKIDTCKDMQEFIISLQQEQPEINIPSDGSGAMGETPPKFKLDVKPAAPAVDLEREIETYFKGWYMDETDQGYILHTPDDHAGLMSVKQIARHFAEWGAEHLKQ